MGAAGLAGLSGLSALTGCAGGQGEGSQRSTSKLGGPMKVLILGGTGFLGPHFVRAAVAAGHEVTLFNRGKTNPHLFPELTKLRGDRRAGELSALEGLHFDVVVDTSGYIPEHVTASATILSSARQYLFVSSVSAYAEQGQAGLRSDSALAAHPDPGNDDVSQFYGPLKAQCEAAAEAAMPGKTTVIRPGLIVGPGDPTDRFTYWPVRLARGGEIMAPGQPTDPVQLIDARDLAAFMLLCLERGQTRVYNGVGPAERLSVQEMLETGMAAVGGGGTLTWVDADFLAKREVQPWMEMTVWVPPKDPEFGGLGSVDAAGARSEGLVFRPLAETFSDTLAYWRELPQERRATPRAGLSAEREVEVLAAFHGGFDEDSGEAPETPETPETGEATAPGDASASAA